MFLTFSLIFAVVFLSKVSSDLEYIDADVTLMDSFFVALSCRLFVKMSLYIYTQADKNNPVTRVVNNQTADHFVC